MDDTTYTIDQRRFLRGRQTLILTGNQLKIQWRRGLSLNEYRFDLRGFLPDPVRVRRVPLVRIVMAGFLTVAGLLAMAAGAGGLLEDAAEGIAGGICLWVFAGLAWSSAAKDLVNVMLFQGPGGQFVLWPDHRDQQELKEFLAVLSARIRSAQHPDQDLLRQLRRAEIIDDWGYEQAMGLFEQNGITGGSDSPGTEQ